MEMKGPVIRVLYSEHNFPQAQNCASTRPIVTALTLNILDSRGQLTYTSIRLKLVYWTSYMVKFYLLFVKRQVSSCNTICTLLDNILKVQHLFCMCLIYLTQCEMCHLIHHVLVQYKDLVTIVYCWLAAQPILCIYVTIKFDYISFLIVMLSWSWITLDMISCHTLRELEFCP